MRKIGFFNIGKLGLVKSAGTGKTDINKVIEKWIKEHMVFWYDMSKPVDTYAENFNDWTKYAGTKCTVTNKSVNITNFGNIGRPSIYIDTSKKFNGITITVDGLLDGQEIAWGYINNPLVRMPKNGTYILEPINSLTETIGFRSINIVGDCNITITQLPSGQSVPTNEILKANPYLQDFSGNNRPLKLNNFLFAAMSGVGGYETNFSDNSIWISSPQNGNLINNHTYNPMLKGSVSGLYTATSSVKVKFKATVTGMKSGYRLEFGSGDVAPSDKSIYEDGEYEFGSDDVAVPYGFKLYADDYSNPNTDVIIELKEVYPNALVTDGVDDYGVVENLQQGVKVLFVTVNPFIDGKFIYDQRLNTTEPWLFAVFNDKGSIAYNSRNSNGKTYIDGTLNESTIVSALLNKKQIITIVNNDVTGDKTKTPVFFSNTDHNSGWISSAFYNSIGFDSVPTKETDGFTEQDLIDYYIPKAIVTITVVDVSGSPIQDATVTVGGVQYKTLSDGTVKVRGMANGTMSLSVKKDGYMPFSDNSWKLADSRITLEVLRNTVITENGYSILLENDGLILTE